MSLVVFGLNHKSAPLAVLEKVVIIEDRIPHALVDFSTKTDADESVILSTCNRCEIYGVFQSNGARDAMAEWLSAYRGIAREAIDPHCFSYQDTAAARHLMRVSSSIDSMIVGEAQILGQVKSAYRIALDHKTPGPNLCRLFESSLAIAKQIRTTTALGKYPVSYAPAIIKASRRLFESLADKNILLIGTGEMIDLAASHFNKQNIAAMSIAGRSEEKALALAKKFSATAVNLGDIQNILHLQDIVVSCTASTSVLLHAPEVLGALKKRRHKPVLMVDMALPRDLDERIKELPDVYLYTLEDLAEIIDENKQARLAAARQAEALIQEKADEYTGWMNSRRARELITELLTEAEDAQAYSLEKAKNALRKGKSPEDALSELAASLTGKLLHPTLKMLTLASAGKQSELLDAMEKQLDGNRRQGDGVFANKPVK